MHNFPPHLSYVATLPGNTLATDEARCFPLCGWLWKDHGRCDQLIADRFQYSLTFDWCIWRIFLTDRITLSVVHDLHLPLPGRLSAEPTQKSKLLWQPPKIAKRVVWREIINALDARIVRILSSKNYEYWFTVLQVTED